MAEKSFYIIDDYQGNSIKVPKTTRSFTRIKGRSYDMERSYYATGMPFDGGTREEVQDKYQRWQAGEKECFYCGRKRDHLDSDHLVPNSKTGERSGYVIAHNIHEFVRCCSRCNELKNNRDPMEWYSDPATEKYLKSECGLSDERYQAKKAAMAEDLDRITLLKVSDAAYDQADRDLSIKDQVAYLLEKMAMERTMSIMRDNNLECKCKPEYMLTPKERKVWEELGDVLVKHRMMKRRKVKDSDEEFDESLF